MKEQRITKETAVAMFKEGVMPRVIRKSGKKDYPAMRQAWNDYVDTLQKEGYISEYQADTWQNPIVPKKHR